LVIALIGCTTTKIVKVEVLVPVPCPVITMPIKPTLPIIMSSAKPEERAGLLRQALAQAMAYAKILEAKLQAYTKPPESPK
jgi:hypothetical protein